MNAVVKHVSMVSAVALLTFGAAGLAGAQSNNRDRDGGECAGNMENCGPQEMRRARGDDDANVRRRLRNNDDDGRETRSRNNDDDGQRQTRTDDDADRDDNRRVRQSRADWRFDVNRHERRRERDDRFRFYFGGFWYPEPYWLGYGLGVGRVSCGEGRRIVRDYGFNRVRPLECRGRTFTYLGRQQGDNFRVIVNSRTGRIIDIDPV